MKTVYLGLGSNVGDRHEWLRSALARLDAPDLKLQRASSVYESEPVGFRDQGWFLNMAAEFQTELFPRQLLHRIQRVELELGRKRSVLNGPRTIDIDVLLYGSRVIHSEELEVPHPRFRERRFVLEPLAELNAELRDPVGGRTVAEMLKQVREQAVRRLPSGEA